MAVDAARVERDQAPLVGAHGPGTTTAAVRGVDADDEIVQFSTGFSRKRHWLLAEHVVRGGESLIPGTGFLEMARTAAIQGPTTRAGRDAPTCSSSHLSSSATARCERSS